MQRLLPLLIPILLFAACAQPRYLWQHEAGLGEQEFQRAKNFCDRYAAEQTPPDYYRNYPYAFGGYPFYYDDYWPGHRHYPYGYPGYFPRDRFPGMNITAYRQDLSRACLKGRGWDRIEVDGN